MYRCTQIFCAFGLRTLTCVVVIPGNAMWLRATSSRNRVGSLLNDVISWYGKERSTYRIKCHSFSVSKVTTVKLENFSWYKFSLKFSTSWTEVTLYGLKFDKSLCQISVATLQNKPIQWLPTTRTSRLKLLWKINIVHRNHIGNIYIIIISNLSNDRSKASSKTIPPHSAI